MFILFISSAAWSLQIFKTGSSIDKITNTKQAICLAGGGSDDTWADGWKYLLEQSGGGDVVIIRADGQRGGYESWIYNDEENHNFPKVNSVTTLSFESSKDGNQDAVVRAILNAELIFFAGGDQSLYINWFRDTKMFQVMNYMMHVKKIPVGGTSAGMALLAGIDYSARYASPTDNESNVSSADVLNNPTGFFVDLDRTVFTAPYLGQVITDTHFSQRSREGRLVGFMARAVYNNYDNINFKTIKAIASDEDTAFCYNSSGYGKVFGVGNVFFLKGNRPIERIKKNSSLDWFGQGLAIKSYVISAQNQSARFNIDTWVGLGGHEELWAVNGVNGATSVLERH
ncbi:MAG: cyanophycinase [Pseudobdellovibrio sp.]